MTHSSSGTSLHFALWLGCIATVGLSPIMAEAKEWTSVSTEKGIEVELLEKGNGELPAFRGTGIIEAPLLEVAVVILDAARLPEWAHKCAESRLIQDDGDQKGRVIYNRTSAPWPVADRDVVVRSRMELDREKKQVSFVFHGVTHPKAPSVDGVVRMVKMKGHYRLRVVSESRTEVQYMIDADPGGSLPKWIVKLASESLPLETVKGLRKQVRKMRNNPKYVALRKTLLEKYGTL